MPVALLGVWIGRFCYREQVSPKHTITFLYIIAVSLLSQIPLGSTSHEPNGFYIAESKLYLVVKGSPRFTMSLACLVCHSVESPSQSFRSYSISSSDNEGRCSVIVNCLTRKASLPPETESTAITLSKVMPHPIMVTGSQGITGTPRLVRSCAVRRDLVRDWNFDEVVMER